MTTITIPHNLRLNKDKDLYALEYLASKKRFAVLVWHRRAKKSRCGLSKQLMRIVQRKNGGVCYYALPTYKQAKTVMWDSLVKEHIPMELIEKINDSELAIYYKNGVIQRFIGAEDHDKHRGTNPFDVVFDEFSEQPEEIWTAIFQPVLRENNGTATFIFTPKGKNHSWKILQLAKQQNEEWYWSVKTVADTHVFTEQELQEIQRNTPQSLYQQEYMCSFLEGAGQFFRRIRENTYDLDYELPLQGDFQLGVDLAKYQDWTVITPFNVNNMIVYQQERFNQIDWVLIKARIEASARRHNDARVKLDATGVGDPIVEDLKARGLTIYEEDAFKFTETSRMNLLNHLSLLLEQDKIKIPADEGLISELESFQCSLSERGKIKVGAPENMHDDRVMSLALAVWGITDKHTRDAYMEYNILNRRANPITYK